MNKSKLTRTLMTAVSAVALSAVAYGCSSGVSDADHQAALDAAKAAEEQAAKVAEEAAAAAEEAAAAAEEAAAQAERDEQAAVEAARQEAIAQLEKTVVMDAVAAAQASVAALMDDSSDADVTGAVADIAKAAAAIVKATSFSEADTAMYTSQVSMTETSLATAQANIRAYRAEKAAEEAENQATAAERAKKGVEDAITGLTAASAAEVLAETTYSTVADTLEEAQEAVANANSDSLPEASAALAEALIAASTAAADLSVKTQAVADATAVLMAAKAALAEADPDHVALQAADAALLKAMTGKDELATKVADLQKQIDDLVENQRQAEEDRKQAEENKAKEEEMKAMAAAGKALQAALGTAPLDHLDSAALASTGLTITSAKFVSVGIKGKDTTFTELKAVEGSEGTLGDWESMKYAHTDTGTKVTNEAMVYTNQAAPTTKAMATYYAVDGNLPGNVMKYDSPTRTVTLKNGADLNIAGGGFPAAGTKTYTADSVTNAVVIPGSYQGASGSYSCTGSPACEVKMTAAGLQLIATVDSKDSKWAFIHDAGAMVSIPDSAYLFFGWWLNSDKDGPEEASAFTGKVGLFADLTGDKKEDELSLTSIVGSATYAGEAAGKWAIDDPLHGGDGGHFTADATLTAKFGDKDVAGAGVTGVINNFMANGNAVPWSVALNNRTLDGASSKDNVIPASNLDNNGQIKSALSYKLATPKVDESKTTVWSIDGKSAAASGTWNGQMYDEMPGGPGDTPAGDGSDVPTTVTGVFQSTFGSTHTMVGAFGADKQ